MSWSQAQPWAAHVHSEEVDAGQEHRSAQAGVQRVVVLAAVEVLVGVEAGSAWGPKASARHRAATSCAAMTIAYILVQARRKMIACWLIRGLVRRSFGTRGAQTKQYKTG